MSEQQRESWGSRIGVILAAAGSAVGIGNLLRFPGQAAQHGGGAFMIPYILSLLLFGLPMMWVAWTVGRMGGRWGHGTTPGMFWRLSGKSWGKYLGVIGVALPMIFILYYTYIEAWCLGYAWFSMRESFVSHAGRYVDLRMFYDEFLGNGTTHSYFPGIGTAVTFLAITLALNVWVLFRGINRGIETLAKIAIPLLLLFCLILSVRVLTLGRIEGSVWDGLRFLWSPDLTALTSPKVWMAAAGQIFFTLSIGYGCLECFGSYLKQNDDLTLTGLTTASLNEFVEVIFGSMIAIPAAAVYFGADKVPEIAGQGTFAIGMVSMAEILRGLPALQIFGTIWFLLLFFAAFTSSVAVAQPVMSFLEDEARLSRASAAGLLLIFWTLGSLPIVLLYRYGALNELDFWAGTIGLVVFTIVEIILFSWVYGIDKGWEEMHRGAVIQVPRVFRFVLKYVTPVLLLLIFAFWFQGAVVSGDLLAPAPKLHWGIIDRETYDGEFRTRAATEGNDARDLAALEAKVADRVSLLRRDLDGWATVVLHPSAPLVVAQWSGDPALLDVLRPKDFQRWLSLQGLRYQTPQGAPQSSIAINIAFQARYRETAIWITRLVIVVFNAGFLLMVWAIWKQRYPDGHPPREESR
ncbi:MAG: sodium-dependent transporter [Acidobacteriota bacterium]|nr:sodium-dependent transporter [Acidobacteriota bacterium]